MVCGILNVYNCVNRRHDNYWEGLNDGMDSVDADSISEFCSDKNGDSTCKSSNQSLSTHRLQLMFGMFHLSLPKPVSQAYLRRSIKTAKEETKTEGDEFLMFPTGSDTSDGWRPLADDSMPDKFDEEASVQFSLDDIKTTYSI